MIVVKKSPEPPSLAKARQWMEKQVNAARSSGLSIELLKKSAKLKNPPGVLEIRLDDALYKPPEAKARLILDHHGKCAYCETRFMDTAGGDVEHFRPKKGFNEFDRSSSSGLGPRTKLGYFFLAYTWENHLWACKECNETYKKNYFGVMPDMSEPPDRDDFTSDQDFDRALKDWASAMTKHSDWTTGSVQTEQGILIDPSKEDPREHIQFDPQSGYAVGAKLDDKGKIVALSHRGGATILYLGLNRKELVFARARHLTLLRGIFVEMTRDQDLVRQFLEWQRGTSWAEEAKVSLHVPRVPASAPPEGPPEIESGRKARWQEEQKKRNQTFTPWTPNFGNVQLDPTDEPVKLDRRQPDPGPFFSNKDKVTIPGEFKIRDDPKLSPLDFLIYAVTPRAVFSALAADALAAWSLELAEHLVKPREFVAQLNRPQTSSPSPNRATVSLFELDTHTVIMNFYAADHQVLESLAENHRIERAAFDAGSDAHGVCFVCRKILADLMVEHDQLSRSLAHRHTLQYDQEWVAHARKLDELEQTFGLYGCTRGDWEPALKTMNENLDNYPHDLCHDIPPTLKAHVDHFNELIKYVSAPADPRWMDALQALYGNAAALVDLLVRRGAQDEPEYAVAVEVRDSAAKLFNSCSHTDQLNKLIGNQQWIMSYAHVRQFPDYALHHGNATRTAAELERTYQECGLDIPEFTARLAAVKSGLQQFPPDSQFVPGTPQAQFTAIALLGPPPTPGAIMGLVDEEPPAPWVTPKASKVRSDTYAGRGQESAVYEQVRYHQVKR